MTKKDIKKLQERIIKDINNICKIDKNKIEYDDNNSIVIKELNNIYLLKGILDKINIIQDEIYFNYDCCKNKVYIYYIMSKKIMLGENKDDVIVFRHNSGKYNNYDIIINIKGKFYCIGVDHNIDIIKESSVIKNKDKIREIKKEINNIIIEYILNEVVNNDEDYIVSNINKYKNIVDSIIYS